MIDGLRHLPDVGIRVDGHVLSARDGQAQAVGDLAEEVAQLRTALATNRRIGLALGIAMKQLDVDEEEAFDVLRRISQQTNRKLRDVAEDVVHHRRLSVDSRPSREAPG